MTQLKQEVASLRSLVISLIGKDKEGEYKPEFVREVLKTAQEKPGYTFKTPKEFLTQLSKQ